MANNVKFNFGLGDTVFFMSNNKVSSGVVKTISCAISQYEDEVSCSVMYRVDDRSPSSKDIEENNCFSTKAKLLKNL